MSAKKDANLNQPLYAFNVALVGDRDLMRPDECAALLGVLLTRHRDSRRIVILSPSDGPEIEPPHGWRWAVHLVPRCSGAVKQDCEIIAQADAIVVLGDPSPWSRLLALAAEARIPTRVYRERPRVRRHSIQAEGFNAEPSP